MTRCLVPSRAPQLLRSCQRNGLLRRSFHTSIRRSEAHEFSMPAMSPTMTEGNIASWKVKEGESFSAGDVILEIETDKAQMDVEAQDEGIMAKIIEQAGAKGVKVGTRIAITADPEDNLETLDLSAMQASKPASAADESKQAGSASQQEGAPTPTAAEGRTPGAEKTKSEAHTPGQAPHNTKYPLFPSVIQLLHERGIGEQDSNQIPASGPSGRLLKGDVLAYLGEIKASYASDLSERIKGLGHLDLSNIELAPVAPKAADPAPRAVVEEEVESARISEVALPISLAAVEGVQLRVKEVLGIEVSIEEFIARAAQVCNEDLPRPKAQAVSADELFDAVLGLDQVSPRPTGPILIPSVHAFATAPKTSRSTARSNFDIIDELSGSSTPRPTCLASKPSGAVDPEVSVFSVEVPAGDEKRARVFLERLKTVLQVEPGRLVL